MKYKIYEGKMQDVLKALPDNSIDSCICDPPYDLTTMTKRWGNAKTDGKGQYGRLTKGFMGKTWDGTGVAFDPNTWAEVYRVLKPGGYLLAFGGTRTYHRMAVAIEDAGFEIRDCIMWLYGSGFPKSHNIGLDVDKMNGCPDRGHRIAVANRNHPDGTLEPNGEQLDPYEAKTEEGKKWSSWGTALKPAYEPIVMARKPIEDTVAKNCLKYGVGGINIDECRIKINDFWGHGDNGHYDNVASGYQRKNKSMFADKPASEMHENGRFPANVITDGSDEVAAGMPETKSQGGCSMKKSMFGLSQKIEDYNYYDEGSAMRYFYCAKASKKDRDEGLDIETEEYVLKENINEDIKNNIKRLLNL